MNADRTVPAEWEVQDAFRAAIQEHGITPPEHVVSDGRLHRFHVEGDRPRTRNGWYVLHADGLPAGAFGSWRTGLRATWHWALENGRGPAAPADRDALRTAIEERRREETAERERLIRKARGMWERAGPADPQHRYLRTKRISAHGVRQIGSVLSVPAYRVSDRAFRGMQRIWPNGTKRFAAGTDPSGACYAIGDLKNRIVVAEGFATAATIHEATGDCVAVAFNAGNVDPVARAIREKQPETTLVVAADNDRKTNGNPGLTAATKAARAVNGLVAIPRFEESEEGTDFNDLEAVRGIGEVAKVVLGAEDPPQPSRADGGRRALSGTGHPLRLPTLPNGFWETRDSLRHIRQAAHAMIRSPDAVLHCVLARIGAFRPPVAALDTGIGAAASLNYLAALVDASGAGKSSPEKIARRLIPMPEGEAYVDNLPIGTGEGIAETYMGIAYQKDEKGKRRKVRKQVRHFALFYADEGQAFLQIGNRRGATIGETIRRCFGGEVLGQQNAAEENRRVIRDYSLGLIVGFQPEIAYELLIDAGLGTPQRFIWSSVVDPAIPDTPPPWPGFLDASIHVKDVKIEAAIKHELRQDALAYVRGQKRRPLLDAHEPLCRLKIAAGLAYLRGGERRIEIVIGDADWELARIVWETSCAVRDEILAWGKKEGQKRRRVAAHHKAEETTIVGTNQAHVKRVAGVIRRRVQKSSPCSKRDLTQAVAGRDRKWFPLALEYALGEEWIAMNGTSYGEVSKS